MAAAGPVRPRPSERSAYAAAVPADREPFDAVLPLVVCDLERAALLRETLERDGHAIRRVWVVAPKADVPACDAFFGGDARWPVLAEETVVPSLTAVDPWYVQQLVKLAFAERAATPVYLTLDADVLVVRPVAAEDLLDARGRAAAVGTKAAHNVHLHPHAERVLGVPAAGTAHGVTPSLLSRAGVLDLIAHLGRRARAQGDEDWVRYLIRMRPWSEYTLYSNYLESTGAYDELHERRGFGALYGNCVWHERDWAEWDPRRSFEDDRFFFSVVQSTAGIPVDEVRERIAPFL